MGRWRHLPLPTSSTPLAFRKLGYSDTRAKELENPEELKLYDPEENKEITAGEDKTLDLRMNIPSRIKNPG
jgi:hypothetical protein